MEPEAAPDDSVRLATCLVGWFEDSSFTVEHYLTGRQSVVPPQLLPALLSMHGFSTRRQTLERLGGAAATSILDQLVGQDILLTRGSRLDAWERSIEDRWPWGRDARLFHFSTRRTHFGYDLQHERDALLERARTTPQPPAFKDYGRTDLALPPSQSLPAGLVETLQQRRTGRSFSDRPVALDQLATILQLTWGVTSVRPDPGVGVVALKTSPSGGARHPVEVYCVPQNVSGLDPAVYHYCAGRHALSHLATPPDLETMQAVVTHQPWVAQAAAVFIMTGMTRRSGWKYPQSHAYRVLLLDAGHLGQTFHLVSTALGLSPWTSAAVDEEAAERLLGIEDDPSELVVYAAACGWPAS